MTITIDSEFTPAILPEYAEGNVISVSDVRDIIRSHNLQWSVAGVQSSGVVFDPVFTTTSTSYTLTNSASNGRDMDTLWSTRRTLRGAEFSATAGTVIEVCALLANSTLGIEMFSGETLLGTLELTQASSSIIKTTGAIFIANTLELPITIQPKGLKTSSGTARCASYVARDYRLTGTYMPRGR